MEMLRPLKFDTECVIIGSSPPNRIGWIHHEMQNIVQQWISFLPDGHGATNISVWLEIDGKTLEISGRDVIEVMREFKQQWYSRFAKRCNELALTREGRMLA